MLIVGVGYLYQFRYLCIYIYCERLLPFDQTLKFKYPGRTGFKVPVVTHDALLPCLISGVASVSPEFRPCSHVVTSPVFFGLKTFHKFDKLVVFLQ